MYKKEKVLHNFVDKLRHYHKGSMTWKEIIGEDMDPEM